MTRHPTGSRMALQIAALDVVPARWLPALHGDGAWRKEETYSANCRTASATSTCGLLWTAPWWAATISATSPAHVGRSTIAFWAYPSPTSPKICAAFWRKTHWTQTDVVSSCSDAALTTARLEALRALLEEELMPFLYSEDAAWWMQPITTLQSSGRRLIFLLQVDSSQDWLNALTAQGVRHFKAFDKCETDDGFGACTGPFWGKYSYTCCKPSKLMRKQRARQQVYAEEFLLNRSCAEARRFNATRPMLQLYWTMTFKVSGRMTDENGSPVYSLEAAAEIADQSLPSFFKESADTPVFANVLMGDRLESSKTFLEIAVRSTMRCEAQEPGRRSDDASSKYNHKYLVMSIIFASTLAILALSLCALRMLRVRDAEFRRQSLAARATQAARLSEHAQMVQLSDRRATAPARTVQRPLGSMAAPVTRHMC
ncbi:unnamed protein product [Symbiodinium natans]|uniref:Uncharacterized protein n=1 Tax=Symbiodinium natans TaxID=878477 RepID=A0A812Q3G4_9DINO|nr:unnamed protein product [Symbiodinium natans]